MRIFPWKITGIVVNIEFVHPLRKMDLRNVHEIESKCDCSFAFQAKDIK